MSEQANVYDIREERLDQHAFQDVAAPRSRKEQGNVPGGIRALAGLVHHLEILSLPTASAGRMPMWQEMSDGRFAVDVGVSLPSDEPTILSVGGCRRMLIMQSASSPALQPRASARKQAVPVLSTVCGMQSLSTVGQRSQDQILSCMGFASGQ